MKKKMLGGKGRGKSRFPSVDSGNFEYFDKKTASTGQHPDEDSRYEGKIFPSEEGQKKPS